MRKAEFINGEYYHVYNRGVDKRNIFSNKKDYDRMIETIWFVNDKKTHSGLSDHKRKLQEERAKRPEERPPRSAESDLGGQEGGHERLVEVICYCLNPNHYHFILRQLTENGISLFMGKLSNSYTKYYNTKHDRSGPLYSGKFKSVHIDSNNYFLYLSVYVNGNHFIHGYEELGIESVPNSWQYSSYLDYIGRRDGRLCQKNIILNQFKDKSEYKDFCRENMLYLKDKKISERYLLEEV